MNRQNCSCFTPITGPPGSNGLRGPVGPRGLTGETGIQGVTGPAGQSTATQASSVFLNSGGFLQPNQWQRFGSQLTSEPGAQIVMMSSATLANLTVSLVTAPGVGNFRNFVVRKNAVDTALAVTMTGADVDVVNSTNFVGVVQFDKISLRHLISGIPDDSVGIMSFKVI